MAIDSTPRSRRTLLAGLVGGVATAIAGSLGRAQPARAHDADDVRLGGPNSTNNATSITNTTPNSTTLFLYTANAGGNALVAVGHGDGHAFRGESEEGNAVQAVSGAGYGLEGLSFARFGVHGAGTTGGVLGTSASANATGVKGQTPHVGVEGQSTATTGEHYGVYGESKSPAARAIFGRSVSTSGGTGMWGQADTPGGVGVRGLAYNINGGTGGYGTGVIGSSGSQTWPTTSPNTGVLGVGKNGRGGVFGGDVAQVRLLPSTAANHPASGVVGDLFLDSSTRLWFCKGGANWVQLA